MNEFAIHADSLLDSGNQDILPGTDAVTHSENPGISIWIFKTSS
jgi:hypothetical protein